MFACTGDEAGEVGLNGLELVDVILPLLVCDLPGVVVGAGLSLDLVGHRRRGHRSYRCAFLKETNALTFARSLRAAHLKFDSSIFSNRSELKFIYTKAESIFPLMEEEARALR